jgi:flagellin-like hook-associated protein FlgL
MVSDVGNILNITQQRQLFAIKSTANAVDKTQLRLATGQKFSGAVDNPQNFFASQKLNSKSSDLTRLLDGIGQNIQVIKAADAGVRDALKILDIAEAFLNETELGLINGTLTPDTSASGAVVITSVADVLAANPEAIHLGGGEIVHTYDSVGTFTFNPPGGVTDVRYLVVGGGGGGGSSTSFSTAGSGGGGAGGVLTGNLTITTQPYTVVVGAGGVAGAPGNNSGQRGQASSFGTVQGTDLTALGGGFGIGGNGNGGPGGSGGGGRGGAAGNGLQGGTPQGGLGNDGGTGPSPGGNSGGGGGGAGGVGGALSSLAGGNGGAGTTSDITGTLTSYGGGGGGGGANADIIGTGGIGGGGNGGNDGTAATAGIDGLGGGGGGGNNNRVGARGGAGTVVVRYTFNDILGGPSIPAVDPLSQEYTAIIEQLDLLVADASYRGTNLLDEDELTTFFNEFRTSSLVSEGISANSDGLGLRTNDFTSLEQVQLRIEELRLARESLRAFSSSLSNDLNIIRTREISINQLVNVFDEGRDKLTIIDQNEEGAKMLALQTRQAIQFSSFSARTISIADFLL